MPRCNRGSGAAARARTVARAPKRCSQRSRPHTQPREVASTASTAQERPFQTSPDGCSPCTRLVLARCERHFVARPRALLRSAPPLPSAAVAGGGRPPVGCTRPPRDACQAGSTVGGGGGGVSSGRRAGGGEEGGEGAAGAAVCSVPSQLPQRLPAAPPGPAARPPAVGGHGARRGLRRRRGSPVLPAPLWRAAPPPVALGRGSPYADPCY